MAGGRVVSWGELLWDRMPDGDRLGGCACNVAFHVGQLGGHSSLISCVGNDTLGARALETLRGVGVDVDAVRVDPELRTGVVQVTLEGGQPRYTIVERVAWDHLQVGESARRVLERADVFVFGTLAQRTALARSELVTAARHLPDACVKICDLNLRSPFIERDVVLGAIELADVVKLNQDEAQWCKAACGRQDAVTWMLDECGVDSVIVTNGAQGSDWYTRGGALHQSAESFPAEGAADAVGAGDAFAAGLALATALARPPEDVARLASRLGGVVASRAGATPTLSPDVVAACRRLLGR